MEKPTKAISAALAFILLAGWSGSWAFATSSTHSRTSRSASAYSDNPAAMSSAQVQQLYNAIDSVPSTPTEFVNAYMRALATGSGLFARAYLLYPLRNSIPFSVGLTPDESIWHPWITHWTVTSHGTGIKEYDINTNGKVAHWFFSANYFTVTAFGWLKPDGSAGSGALFQDKLAVVSFNPANPLADIPPYVIDAQSITWLHPRYIHHF